MIWLTREPNSEELRVHVLKQTVGQSGVSVELQFQRLAGMVQNGIAPSTPEEYTQ